MVKAKQKSKENNAVTKPRMKKKIFKAKDKQKDIMRNKVPSNSNEFSANWKAFLVKQKLENTENQKKPRDKEDKDCKFSKSSDKKSGFKKKKVFNETSKGKKLDETSENVIWFDGVDPKLLEKECGIKNVNTQDLKHVEEKESEAMEDKHDKNITKYVALDCEMVGIGWEGKENALARVSLVNSLGDCIYDNYCKPKERVVDYRTAVSGIRPNDLKNASSYETVQKEVADILKGRILVGHALQNDLKVLMLSHSRRQIRDTSKYKPFRKLLKTKRPALKKLAAEVLNTEIQTGEHSSVIDARVTMEIYQKNKKEWERSLRVKDTSNNDDKDKKKEIFMGDGQKRKPKQNKWSRIKKQRKAKE